MTATTAPSTTEPGTVARLARIGTAGAALWALMPVAFTTVSTDDVEYGTLPFVGVAASYWLFAVIAPALLVAGAVALRRALGPSAGRWGAVGIAVAAVGYGSMALGTGIEVASISAGGGEVDLGHALLLIGFLVSIAGGIITGVLVLRRRRDGLSRTAGMLLMLALPVGVGLGLLGSAVDPANDAWFWAAIAVPTAIAWVLLGRSLATEHRVLATR
jgi:hypothetical protein